MTLDDLARTVPTPDGGVHDAARRVRAQRRGAVPGEEVAMMRVVPRDGDSTAG